MEASSDLRALIIPFAGLPRETRELMLDHPQINVHNLHHNAVSAAEMAVTLMLAASKCILPHDRALRRHDWRPRYQPTPAFILEGRTALVLGYGAVGQRVADACRGLGMSVSAIQRTLPEPAAQQVYTSQALPDLLPQADVLIIALPLTDQTLGLIGQEELALLPSESVLVNVGRGPIVHEESLYDALRDGTLHAAGLDVWYNYPEDEASRSSTPPSAYPFHKLENVVMSPHRGGAAGSEEIERRRMSHLATLLNAAARGDQIPNQVNIEAGY
jgi:phosphoglycerate dehydrogenase-like enzyme